MLSLEDIVNKHTALKHGVRRNNRLIRGFKIAESSTDKDSELVLTKTNISTSFCTHYNIYGALYDGDDGEQFLDIFLKTPYSAQYTLLATLTSYNWIEAFIPIRSFHKSNSIEAISMFSQVAVLNSLLPKEYSVCKVRRHAVVGDSFLPNITGPTPSILINSSGGLELASNFLVKDLSTASLRKAKAKLDDILVRFHSQCKLLSSAQISTKSARKMKFLKEIKRRDFSDMLNKLATRAETFDDVLGLTVIGLFSQDEGDTVPPITSNRFKSISMNLHLYAKAALMQYLPYLT